MESNAIITDFQIANSLRQGYKYFRDKLHAGFKANGDIDSEQKLTKALEKGEFIYKGMFFPSELCGVCCDVLT
jgi:hypothetical protein